MRKLWPYLLLCVSSIVIAGGAIEVGGSSSILSPGATGNDLTLAGPLNISNGASTGFAVGLTPYANNSTNSTGICFEGAAGGSCANAFISYNGNTQNMTFKAPGAAGLNFASLASSSVASPNNAFAVTVNGARIDFGAGASDYASSDGTTVTFAGPVATQALAATTGTFSGVVALNSGAGNILTLGSDQFVSWPAGGAKISGAASGNLYESFGASTANIGGALCVNTTGVGNLGPSGPDDLQSCTIPANTLLVTGRCFEVKAFGTVANNANPKTVRLTIGPTPTAIITKQLNISVASTWKIEATICRTSASNQSFVAEAYNFGGTAVTSVEAATDYDEGVTGTLTQTETNSLVIKTQSTVSTTDNDIISSMLIVKAL